MVVLARQCSRAIKNLRAPCRLISTSSLAFAATKTVKSYGELPTGLLNPDGTHAAPLEEWWGGPDANTIDGPLPRRIRAKKRGSPTALLPSNDQAPDSQVEPQVPKPSRRTRKSAIALATDNTSNGDPTAPEGTPVKPKRSRKLAKKAANTNNEVQAELSLPSSNLAEDDSGKPQKGKTRKSRVDGQKPTEVPQGLLGQDILRNLEKFPHCILLTKVGQFYESYFDQAIEVARILGIKQTSRKWAGTRIPMCGFPLIHLDKHLKTLVQQNNRFVAMCEEFPDYTEQKTKTFTRRVTRIITPGTLIDEPFLNPYENNYLLAITLANPDEGDTLGLAWIDVSTGEFFSKSSNLENLQDELARIGPREVVLDESLRSQPRHAITQALAEDDHFVSYLSPSEECSSPADLRQSGIASPVQPELESGSSLSVHESSAIALLTEYLHSNLMEHMPNLSAPNREGLQARMQIDSHTIKALEIREGYREGGTKGSLLSSIKRTVTTGGTRLLARRLCSPSTSIPEINGRQSLVALFFERPHLRDDLRAALAELEDISRVVQKFVLGRGGISDLHVVRKATDMWSKIFQRIEQEKQYEQSIALLPDDQVWASMDSLTSSVIDLQLLSARIQSAVDDQNGSSLATDPEAELGNHGLELESTLSSMEAELNTFWRYGSTKWSIKPTFSHDLARLHRELQGLLESKDQMEKRLQLKYDAPSLTLRASPAQGMHVHLAKGKRDQSKLLASDEFVSIAESGSTRCFFYKEWSILGGQIADTTLALTAAEKEAFEILRNEITAQAPYLRGNAEILDEIDVALAFASLAAEMKFIRPVLTEGTEYNVINGRHPTVELGLLKNGRVFTPNSTNLTSDSMVHIITGPNMAGKSTYLRQTALTAILAQSGSFVPADSAHLGIVDKLFSRIGAKDDLFHDRSTFMVEMLETADILRRASPRSLVIMDEVGRGTTVTDGLAIAYATIHHLITENKCRCLFATHFHELADMLGYPDQHKEGPFDKIDFFCTDVVELEDDYFAYQYRVQPGINRDSHGIKVAQLAGMPPAAIQVAKETLDSLRDQKAHVGTS